ncbi:hypothetical protein KJ966_08860 [bacterium]|nr:hypothetical protein [bacterium]
MKLNFPLKTVDLKGWQNATQHYEINKQSKGGWYPVGMNNMWHSGIHLDGTHPVHAVADGFMIAYRVTDYQIKPEDTETYKQKVKNKETEKTIIDHPLSNNFVLTKHIFNLPEGNAFTFYSLFMHLAPLKELDEGQKKALSIFHKNRITVKNFPNSDGRGLILFNYEGQEIAIMPKGSIAYAKKEDARGIPQWAVKSNFTLVTFNFYGKRFNGLANLNGKADEITEGYKITTVEAKNSRKNGLSIKKDAFPSAEVIDIAPIGAELFFEHPEEVADENSNVIIPADNQYHKKIVGYKFDNTFEAVKGYVDIHEEHLVVDKYYEPELDSIVNCNVEISKGDVVGWSSGDGSSADKKTVHFEIFIASQTDFEALKDYTTAQIQKNNDLKNAPLLQLDNLIVKGDVKAAYDRGRDLTYINKILKNTFPKEGGELKDISVEQAKDVDHISSLLNRSVAKHYSEWVSPSEESEKDSILEVLKNLLFAPQFTAYKQLFFGSLAFWHQLRDSTGGSFPDEAYFFHPIKFIEHLKLISEIPRLTVYNYDFPLPMQTCVDDVNSDVLTHKSCYQHQMKSMPYFKGELSVKIENQKKILTKYMRPFYTSLPEDQELHNAIFFGKLDTKEAENETVTKLGGDYSYLYNYTSSNGDGFQSDANSDALKISFENPTDDYQEKVFFIQSTETLVSILSEGTHHLDHLTDDAVEFLSKAMRGSNLPPILLEVFKAGAITENRKFLKEMLFNGKLNVRIDPITGKTLITFKGSHWLRKHMTNRWYLSHRPEVSVISVYADLASRSKSGVWKGVKSGFKSNAMAFIIVGAIDIFEYVACEDEGKVITDLLVDLGVDFVKVMVAGFMGFIAGAAVILLAASAPVWAVVAAGIAVGIAVGVGLDLIDDEAEISKTLKEKMREIKEDIEKTPEYNNFLDQLSNLLGFYLFS